MPVVYNYPNIRREGTELKDYYSERYNETMAQGEFHHDGLMYTLILAKEKIGWEPFLKPYNTCQATIQQQKRHGKI